MPATRSGRFITLEGGEGTGKSTNIDTVCACLEDARIEFVKTREPGGTDLAEAVRQLTLAAHDEPMPGLAEVLLMFAARSIHIENKIRPALDAGKWVVCDRFVDSSFAYQGYGRELGTEAITTLEKLVVNDIQPGLTLLLDADPEVIAKRLDSRDKDRIEQENDEFFQRVRNGYLERARQAPQRIQVIDASRPLAEVQEQVREKVHHFMGIFSGAHSRG